MSGLFDERFVYTEWDASLKGRPGYSALTKRALEGLVEGGAPFEVFESPNVMLGANFLYYDPNLPQKRAYRAGAHVKVLFTEDNPRLEWEDVDAETDWEAPGAIFVIDNTAS